MTIKSQKLFTLALMFMGGMQPKDMAKKLGMPYRTVLTHVKSELFRAQLIELRRNISTEVIDGVMKRIDAEALPALQVLTEEIHRDLDRTDPKLAPLIAQKKDAAKFLLGDLFMDRRVARLGGNKGMGSDTETGIRVSISEESLREMFQALAEFRGESLTVQFAQPPQIVSAHTKEKEQEARTAVAITKRQVLMPPLPQIEDVADVVKTLQKEEAVT